MTRVLRTPSELQEWRRGIKSSIGFVPTMGALHEGHEELLKKARAENEVVVLSIFVNPTQFNNPDDFAKYPATWTDDLEMARRNEVDVVFSPVRDDLYPDDYRYRIGENDFSTRLCGGTRPGHFEGVLTIVMKLFQLVRPTRAYFGEKDHQQLSLIQGMVESFFLDLEIIPVPTVREKDGLAMSSRNRRLSEVERRELAPLIYQALTKSASASEARKFLESRGFNVDYLEDFQGRRYAAAFLGDVRLIDNVEL